MQVQIINESIPKVLGLRGNSTPYIKENQFIHMKPNSIIWRGRILSPKYLGAIERIEIALKRGESMEKIQSILQRSQGYTYTNQLHRILSYTKGKKVILYNMSKEQMAPFIHRGDLIYVYNKSLRLSRTDSRFSILDSIVEGHTWDASVVVVGEGLSSNHLSIFLMQGLEYFYIF